MIRRGTDPRHPWRDAWPMPPAKWIDRSQSAAVAFIRGYRAKGGGRVVVERGGRIRRYRVSLLRWHRVADWALFGPHPWATSGYSLRNSFGLRLHAAGKAS